VRIVIVGCGRVGAVLAGDFDAAGHDVVVLDRLTEAFDRLPAGFRGAAVRGDGTDEDILRRAGTENADVFIAMTEGDNRNVMAAQLAHEALGVRNVIAKINDPVRAEAYADLGIATICRTNLISDAVNIYLGLPAPTRAGVVAPTGSHPGGEHHEIGEAPAGAGAGPVMAAPATIPTTATPAASTAAPATTSTATTTEG
jgi:trk system potassium uptake protein TrkA